MDQSGRLITSKAQGALAVPNKVTHPKHGVLKCKCVAKMLEEVLRRGNGADLLSYFLIIGTPNGRGSIKSYFNVYIWVFCIPGT